MNIIPPRLHVLLASGSPQALVIRRGPSNRTAVIGWDRKRDVFSMGQWLKGRIYPFRSDISPDGKHWIYFALGEKLGTTYTAVAQVPFLKALDFYPKSDAWNGGGLFTSNHSYWLNDGGPYPHVTERAASGLSVDKTYNNQENSQGECPLVYFQRLRRDGWQLKQPVEPDIYVFEKRISDYWLFIKHFHTNSAPPVGKGVYHDTHVLRPAKGGGDIDCGPWEWADTDGGRIVWAERGQIFAGVMTKDSLKSVKMLLDTCDMGFEELKAPY